MQVWGLRLILNVALGLAFVTPPAAFGTEASFRPSCQDFLSKDSILRLGRPRIEFDRAYFQAAVAFSYVSSDVAQSLHDKLAARPMEMYREGKDYLDRHREAYTTSTIDGVPALRLLPGPTRLGQRVEELETRYHVRVYFCPQLTLEAGVPASFRAREEGHRVVLGPMALLPEFENLIDHELAHARTHQQLVSGFPSAIYGHIESLNETALPFANPNHKRFLAFDDVEAIFTDRMQLVRNLKTIPTENQSEMRRFAQKSFLEAESILSQIQHTATLVISLIRVPSNPVQFVSSDGQMYAEVIDSEPPFAYKVRVPLVMRANEDDKVQTLISRLQDLRQLAVDRISKLRETKAQENLD